jgi:L-ascorbate metabolism protein UlaG (beta-lactamase superfamily)
LIKIDNTNIIIDPFISGNSMCNITLNELERIDYILITHSHSDHTGDAIEIAKKFNSKIICAPELAWYYNSIGVKTETIQIGGKIKLHFGSVKMVYAVHGGGLRLTDEKQFYSPACGFIIRSGRKCIYHAGDTGLSVEMQLLKDEDVDLAFIPIGGRYTMDVEDALRALEFIKPKLAVPIHYGTFLQINESPFEFKEKSKNIKVDILKCLETLEI